MIRSIVFLINRQRARQVFKALPFLFDVFEGEKYKDLPKSLNR